MSRIDKVNQQLKREISTIIQRELGDPRLEFVTITHADVSRDLRHAKIFFSVLGGVLQVESAQKGLESAGGVIRKLVGGRMTMRYVPQLLFIHDKSIELSARIEQTLREIKNEDKESH